jgi:hypothetical protein
VTVLQRKRKRILRFRRSGEAFTRERRREMLNSMRTVMEFHDVDYTDRPRVIRKMLMTGFSINDISVRRVSACHYDIVAMKGERNLLGGACQC